MSSLDQAESRSKTQKWAALLAFLIVCLGAGGLGAFATTPEIDGWYRTVVKPTWNPPNWVFGPVWTSLYVIMAVAAWLVWTSGDLKKTRVPLSLFGLQLILNLAWSWIFFNAHQIGWALFEILILWGFIAATTWSFFPRSKLAGCLMLPYLAWVTFASVLNFALWKLNSL